ncbi:MAG: DNA primase [Simkaniaceae bacterium]|nr:DNA primase [Candidatus Sacchlamyda saccharinae]
MALYTEESLDNLRSKIDLVELLSSHIQLKRAGASYKALCPFHEEKSPSFVLQSGDDHYHCFGCGAHGDAIAFLMNHMKMSFVEAVESLAERFGVTLEKSEQEGKKRGPDRARLKGALELACGFYHTLLLHTEEGHKALEYLYKRGIDLDFIQKFQIGWAPSFRDGFVTLAKGEGVPNEILQGAGLMTERGRDFFSERVTFPITDPFGSVIGFSARKIREEVFGGKYINTSETPLFKKSNILFGLSYCRQRIAKERKAIIVEGQMDALRLIHAGCNLAVAGQGTAFGDGHVKILTDLGVSKVFLAMDGDSAGKAAAVKIGNLFQKKGLEVSVLNLPEGSDPDAFVRIEGVEAFSKLMEKPTDYLTFLVEFEAKGLDLKNPAQKNELVRKLTAQIRSWEEPVLIHESLRKIAELTAVPESVVGVGASPQPQFIKRMGRVGNQVVDPDRILETDLLRWLLLKQDDHLFSIAKNNLAPDLFRNPIAKKIFQKLIEEESPKDLISLGSTLEDEEEQKLLAEIVGKKVNPEKAEQGLVEVIHRLLIRKWMEEREAIKSKIQSGTCSEEEVLKLAKAFDQIKKNQPTVVLP